MSVVVFAFLAAFLFGVSVHLQHSGMRFLDAQTGILVNISFASVILLILSPLYVDVSNLLTKATLIFVLIGLIQPALTMSLSTHGIKRLGPSLSASIAATNPVFAIYLAWFFLNEVVTPAILFGTLLVVVGVVIAGYRRKGFVSNWPMWCLLLPLGAAFLRALTQPMTKIALAEVTEPIYALLISSLVSSLVLTFVYKLKGRRLPSFNRGYYWFAGSGLLNALGVYFYYSALAGGDVVLVAPIVATAPVMTVLLSQFVFKREVVSMKTWLTIALVAFGVFLVI
ncbi:MAG: DME family drug/metabolite transporter [Parasphingorhabdus sp.]